LLGVSLTGILDNKMMRGEGVVLADILTELRQETINTNKEWSAKIGINPAAAITCVKPSGTVSQLTDSASGIHPRHNQYYIRTVRADRKDPLCQMMVDLGFPHEPCVMKPDHTMVFSFPQKAEGSVTRNDLTAIEHLELWLTYQRHWCEHKPSITITVRDHEWMDVGAFVYKHFDEISGVSFLPQDLGTYRQAPYQDCTKAQYEALLAKMPVGVDWSMLKQYEKTDNTASSQAFACSAGSCELVDISTDSNNSSFPTLR
jgi:ribonucleoside-diphosphate reductase alpha chain